MTVAFESTPGSSPAPTAQVAVDIAAVRTLVNLWPPTMIGLGIALTLAWGGGLLWLLTRTIIALV